MDSQSAPLNGKGRHVEWTRDEALTFAQNSNAIEGYVATEDSTRMAKAILKQIDEHGGMEAEINRRLAGTGQSMPKVEEDPPFDLARETLPPS